MEESLVKDEDEDILNKTQEAKTPAKKLKRHNKEKNVIKIDNLGIKTSRSHLETTAFKKLMQELENDDSEAENKLFFFQPELDEQLLQDGPFLPPKTSKHDLTLVLDLDETLIHFEESEENGQFLIRPQADMFIQRMSQCYEVVIFTAAMKEYADWILDRIDEGRNISHRLYREHTRPKNNVFVKDLSLIGRDIKSCIIVDNNAENFYLQPENGIFIKSWYGDTKDRALGRLAPILEGNFSFYLEISKSKPSNVAKVLKKLKEAMIRGIVRSGSPGPRKPEEN